MTLTVVFVRHGQTDHNLRGIIQGHADVDLNETGRLQGRMCAEALKRLYQFDLAFSSDSSRAAETAELILADQNKPVPLTTQQELRERDMGELSNTLGALMPKRLPPSVEPSEAFIKRLADWFRETIVPLQGQALTVLVVSHGAAIVTLFRQFLVPSSSGGFGYTLAAGVGPLQHCANTSVHTLRIEDDGSGAIIEFNEHSHLTGRGNVHVKGVDAAA